jgi:hypothetical protein
MNIRYRVELSQTERSDLTALYRMGSESSSSLSTRHSAAYEHPAGNWKRGFEKSLAFLSGIDPIVRHQRNWKAEWISKLHNNSIRLVRLRG